MMVSLLKNKTVFIFAIVLALCLPQLSQGGEPTEISWQQYYETLPDISNCSPGYLTQAEKDNVLAKVNMIRSLHDLKPVYYDDSYDVYAASSALCSVASLAEHPFSMDHHTPGTDWHCYSEAAKQGARNSNIFWTSGQSTPIASIYAWMSDRGNPSCGHRRWIIDPTLKFISLGRCDGVPVGGGASNTVMSLYVITPDNERQDITDWNHEYVAYPWGNYPPDIVDKSWYLSFSVIYDKTGRYRNGNVDYSNATVTMKTKSSGSQVSVSSIIYDTDGYGINNCLKWMAPTIQNEVTYVVDIKSVMVNGLAKDYNYEFTLTNNIASEAPVSPTLNQPADGAKNQDFELDLKWSTVQYATNYHLQVSTSQDFSSDIIVDEDFTVTSHPLTNLESETTYYWRVNASNDIGTSPWSDTWSFTTYKSLGKASLLEPADESTDMTPLPVFKWTNIEGNTGYELQVSQNKVFPDDELDIHGTNINGTEYQAEDGDLELGATYYWRVKVKGPTYDGQWSETWSFSTSSNGAPEPPKPLGPLKNEKVSMSPTLTWEAAAGAVSYDIEIALSRDYFEDEIMHRATGIVGTEYTVPDGILDSVKHYWHIRSVGNGGPGEWSLSNRFTCDPNISVLDELESGYTLSTCPNPASDEMAFNFNLRTQGHISINIYNHLGSHVALVTSNDFGPGSQTVNYSATELPQGCYYYTITVNSKTYYGSFSIVR